MGRSFDPCPSCQRPVRRDALRRSKHGVCGECAPPRTIEEKRAQVANGLAALRRLRELHPPTGRRKAEPRTAEQKSEAVRRSWAGLTDEQRTERARGLRDRRGWEAWWSALSEEDKAAVVARMTAVRPSPEQHAADVRAAWARQEPEKMDEIRAFRRAMWAAMTEDQRRRAMAAMGKRRRAKGA